MADETTPTVPAPVAPAVPAVAAQVAPAAPAAATLDPVEFERMRTHILKMDRDAEKLRAERAKDKERMDALRKLALGDDASSEEDPKAILAKREADARAAKEADTALELSLSRALLRGGLVPKDGDLDYVLYKIRRESDLSEAATSGVETLMESLKSKGYVSTLSAAPPAAPPAPKPDAKAAAPAAAATPADPALAAIKDFRQFTGLPFSQQQALRAKYPGHIATLKSLQERKLATTVR